MGTLHYGTTNRMQGSDGEIRRKRSDTLVRTLRREYGDHFATGFRGDAKLEDVLRREKVHSLTEYLRVTRPIAVSNRFASGRDAAKVLGVSKSRADELINVAKESSPVVSAFKSRTGTKVEFRTNKAKGKSRPAVFAVRKRIGSTNGTYKAKKSKAKR